MFNRRYLDLIIYKTYADLGAETERTYVGFLWWIIEPIVSMFIFYIVFGVLFPNRIQDYVPFLFIGIVPWRWLSSSLAHSGNSLFAGRNLMQQVYLPKVIFPVVTILADAIRFGVVFAVLLIFLHIYGTPAGLSYLALPLIVLVQFLLVSGLSLVVAGLVPFFADLRYLVDYVLRLLFFVSGIFWSISMVQNDAYRFYLRLNPIASLIEAYRDVLLYESWPNLPRLLAIAAFSLLCLIAGEWFISRNNWSYPKLV